MPRTLSTRVAVVCGFEPPRALPCKPDYTELCSRCHAARPRQAKRLVNPASPCLVFSGIIVQRPDRPLLLVTSCCDCSQPLAACWTQRTCRSATMLRPAAAPRRTRAHSTSRCSLVLGGVELLIGSSRVSSDWLCVCSALLPVIDWSLVPCSAEALCVCGTILLRGAVWLDGQVLASALCGC